MSSTRSTLVSLAAIAACAALWFVLFRSEERSQRTSAPTSRTEPSEPQGPGPANALSDAPAPEATDDGQPERQAVVETSVADLDGDWVVRGHVFLGSDTPAAQAACIGSLWKSPQPEGEPALRVELTSASDGSFRWPLDAPAEPIYIEVDAAPGELASYGSASHFFPGSEPPTDWTVHVYPHNISITGTVRDANGAPIEAARVKTTNSETRSDAQGGFVLKASNQRRNTTMYADAPGFAQFRTSLKTAELEDSVQHDIQLVPSLVAEGRVLDEQGRALAGVRVTTFRTHDNDAVSDADGTFRLDHLDPRREHHSLYARKDGYAETARQLDATDLDEPLELVMTRGARVEGSVLSPSGDPLPGIELTIGFSQFAYNRQVAISDTAGRYVVDHVPVGPQTLWAQALPWAPAQVNFKIESDESRVVQDVRFELGHFLAGRVLGPDGEPEAGIRVNAHIDHEYIGSGTRTEADGSFRLVGLPDRPLVVELYGSGYVRVEERVTELDREDLELRIAPAGIVRGQVVDAVSGAPVEEFVVRLIAPALEAGEEQTYGYSATWSREGHRFRDEQGRWDTEGEELTPNEWIGVEVQAEGYAPLQNRRVRIQPHDKPAVEVFALSIGAAVKGTVIDADGAPVPNAEVVFRAAGTPLNAWVEKVYEAGITTTDATGSFELTNVAPGESTLWVQAPDRQRHIDGPFFLESEETVRRTVVLPRGLRLAGRALLASGEADAGRKVALYLLESETRFSTQTTTDSEGRFSFENLQPGLYQVSRVEQTEAGDHYSWVAFYEVVEGRETREVEIRNSGSSKLVGTVLLPNGDGADGARVSLRFVESLDGVAPDVSDRTKLPPPANDRDPGRRVRARWASRRALPGSCKRLAAIQPQRNARGR